jgi:hypothetical protein
MVEAQGGRAPRDLGRRRHGRSMRRPREGRQGKREREQRQGNKDRERRAEGVMGLSPFELGLAYGSYPCTVRNFIVV